MIHKAEQALLEVSVQAASVLAKQDPRGYSFLLSQGITQLPIYSGLLGAKPSLLTTSFSPPATLE